MSEENQKTKFNILRIYTKNISFEAPQTPKSFLKESDNSVNIEININNEKIQDDTYEVVIRVTATVKDKTNEENPQIVYIAEVEQAGLFTISDVAEEQLNHILGAIAPSILFPYLRGNIDSLIIKATFPPLMLSPVNFEALYLQRLENQRLNS